MKKILFTLIGISSCVLVGCTSGTSVTTTQEVDVEALKAEIKKEVLQEMKKEFNDKVDEGLKKIEEDVEKVEENVGNLESDQEKLEGLFDMTKVEITTQGEGGVWDFTSSGGRVTWSTYPTKTIEIKTPYTVLIEELPHEYKITHQDFTVTLTSQQCSYDNEGIIYAYFATVEDSMKKILYGCANIKL